MVTVASGSADGGVSALPPEGADALSLNPFGFWPTAASAVNGLGGDAPGVLDGYVFHTPYVFSGGLRMSFRMKFERLNAVREEILAVRVHRLPMKSAGRIEVVHKDAIPLATLMERGGAFDVDIDAVAGDSYAILGLLQGPPGEESSVGADALTMEVYREPGPPKLAQALDDARIRLFGENATRSVRHLLSDEPATLADPVSQICTAAQFEEPVYREWLRRMAIADVHMHRKQWEFVYILQSLARYGAIRDGARGIGFGVGREQIAAVLAASGCDVLGTDLPAGSDRAALWGAGTQHSDSLEGLRHPAICPDDIFDARVSFRPVNMNAIPTDLTGFDFAWSSCAFEHLGSIAAGLRFVENSLACLRPGGLIVHTTELNLTSNRRTVDRGETVLFRRRDMERLALRLRRQGHDVFPIKYDMGQGYADKYIDVPPYIGDAQLKIELAGHVTTSFGIIVRKAKKKRSRLFGIWGGKGN